MDVLDMPEVIAHFLLKDKRSRLWMDVTDDHARAVIEHHLKHHPQ